MTARIISGSNGIFIAEAHGERLSVRIKGKELKSVTDEYNPLAAGDFVALNENNLVVERLPRRTQLQRFNWKLNRPQTLCANAELGFCVVSAHSPPLHPRFLDRLIIACEAGGLKPIIVVNKSDLELDSAREAVDVYVDLGYSVIRVSALEKLGLDELLAVAKGKVVALFGASGVGKSTLLNALVPGVNLRTEAINRKFNRGNHVTNYSIVIPAIDEGDWIDTPGVRDLTPAVDKADLAGFFHEFDAFSPLCAYADCSHAREQGCAVADAVKRGLVNESRYVGYVKLLEELAQKTDEERRYSKK